MDTRGLLSQLRSALIAVLVLTAALGLLYPLAITGAAQLLWPHQASGSRITVADRAAGSQLIGQDFSGHPGYFQSRPSSSSYNAAQTAASNLGPNAARLSAEIASRVAAYLRRELPYDPALRVAAIPPDAVTASGSGVDPDISLANARIQARRVAAVRGIAPAAVLRLIDAHASNPVLGAASVNVLALNLALDAARRTSR